MDAQFTQQNRQSLLANLADRLLEADAAFRQRNPARFADQDVLFVENVAAMLGCAVDQARRIPRSDLPAHFGPGKRLLYLRDDVLQYVRFRPAKFSAHDEGLRGAQRAKRPEKDGAVVRFDPATVIKRLKEIGS